ncbi:hypothetical protein [Altererythrobacter aquiaggeris]|uniref:hypothetical protein n=1 Tax=Aestuarierythrobacter aquiaggeris TaxID=1898396 RepID=UPI003016A9F4
MNRLILGAILTLAAMGIGLFWMQGRAQTEEGAPPPIPADVIAEDKTPGELPVADAAGMTGPAPPEATELSREQRRFFRYDRNRNLAISRNEMLSTRSNAFRKLDADGNNLLDFEEWAVATANRFDAADRNGDRELSQVEFATTRPKRAKKKPSCRC